MNDDLFKEEKLGVLKNYSLEKYDGPVYRMVQKYENNNSCRKFCDENDEVEVIFPDGSKRKIKYPMDGDDVIPDGIHTIYLEKINISKNTYLLKLGKFEYIVQLPAKHNDKIIGFKEFFRNPQLDITDINNTSSTIYGSLFTSVEKAKESFNIIRKKEQSDNDHYIWDETIYPESYIRGDLVDIPVTYAINPTEG